MELTGDRQLEGWCREHGLPLAALLYGDDGYQIQRQRDKLIKMAVTAFPDFNLYTADGRRKVDMARAMDSAVSTPFMAESRAVVLDDLDLTQQSAEEMDRLWRLLQEPPESTALIITVRTVPLDLKKKSGWGSKLRQLCDKIGLVCSFPKPSQGDVARLVLSQAAKLGASMDREAAALLAEYCGGDTVRALNETEKLAAYRGRETITQDTVKLLVEPVTEARAFDLTDKILRRDREGAMAVVEDLLFQRESPVSILFILSMGFADLYRAAVAKRAGIPTAQAQKELGYFGGSAFRYQRALENQRRFSLDTLGAVVTLLAEEDVHLKETGVDAVTELETVITRIFMVLDREGKR